MFQSNPDRPKWLHWLKTCSSTNSWAYSHLATLQHGDVVFTQHQTAGKGQHGRIWYSPPGVLTASFILAQIPAVQLSGFSLAAGLAVIYTIEELMPPLQGVLRLKWPNDVLIDGRKLAGILCESRVKGSMGKVVVGIGLNRCANFDRSELNAKAISLDQISASVPDELVILECLRHHLLQTATQCEQPNGLAAVLADMGSRDALRDCTITLDLGWETVCGEAMGISLSGCLLLSLANGELRAFTSGHIIYES